MADDEDQASKTEDPTERKLQKLRDDGNVPSSKEVNNLMTMLGILLLVGLGASWCGMQMLQAFGAQMQNIGEITLDGSGEIGAVLWGTLMHALVAVVPMLAIFLVVAYLGGWVQTGGLFSTKPLELNLEKISPMAGFKRIFSLKSLAEFLKSLVKLLVVGAVLIWLMWAYRPEVSALVNVPLDPMLSWLRWLLLVLIGTTVVAVALLAGADTLFQRWQFTQDNRMSPKELKDEFKETEGDPHVKSRQRQIRQERAKKRMMQEVPKADVVITNPTHYSVALRYKPQEGDAAPTVLAKGLDLVALKIREIAKENNVPIHEDPPLARALYAQVELDQVIPIQLYEAVAKILAVVLKLGKNRAA
jgi:flagellar biosynthetic protein FlhB